ncbi:DnaD domain protein [Cytobacillus depressus]|uniref:DnaD domain protein n=1 Tax=Cytobacillus depressus TaxID=1602942 RepID=A0A6L3V1N9_9BACI|nr:DnaD domain protein [Cytobacillus depressus]KAB2329725.1 DnaD domain protein [Cytobacillus depressus]
MAKYRVVYTRFWDDPKVVEEMTPEGKYIFCGGKPVEDCVGSELEKVEDVKFISYVAEQIRSGKMLDLYESYVDSSFEFSKIGSDDNAIRVGFRRYVHDTGTKRKTKRKRKEKQLLSRRCGQVFDFYQQNCGILSPFIAEEIGDAVDEFGAPLVMEAMKISLSIGKRNWLYIRDFEKMARRTGENIGRFMGVGEGV